jgi:hypothetical protein
MWHTVGIEEDSTFAKVGTRGGQRLVNGEPGLGGVPSGGGSIGTGTPGWSYTVPFPPGLAKQFLHLVPVGTSFLHGLPHNLISRMVKKPWATFGHGTPAWMPDGSSSPSATCGGGTEGRMRRDMNVTEILSQEHSQDPSRFPHWVLRRSTLGRKGTGALVPFPCILPFLPTNHHHASGIISF